MRFNSPKFFERLLHHWFCHFRTTMDLQLGFRRRPYLLNPAHFENDCYATKRDLFIVVNSVDFSVSYVV